MPTLLNREAMAASAVRSLDSRVDGNLDDFRALVHPEAVNREAVHEPPECRVPGPEGFYATALWLRSAFCEIAFDVNQTVIEDDLVVTHGTMSGRQIGAFVTWNPDGGVERAFVATGKRFAVHHAHFIRLKDDRVIEHWAVRDDNTLALQLGWVPPSPMFLLRCGIATARARRGARRGSV